MSTSQINPMPPDPDRDPTPEPDQDPTLDPDRDPTQDPDTATPDIGIRPGDDSPLTEPAPPLRDENPDEQLPRDDGLRDTETDAWTDTEN
jgi:hypothetical protein